MWLLHAKSLLRVQNTIDDKTVKPTFTGRAKSPTDMGPAWCAHRHLPLVTRKPRMFRSFRAHLQTSRGTAIEFESKRNTVRIDMNALPLPVNRNLIGQRRKHMAAVPTANPLPRIIFPPRSILQQR